MSLTLEPMTADRFVLWNEQLVTSFAQEKVAAGNWSEEGALERAAREQDELLPQGVATPGHDVFVAVVDGEDVGVLWLFTDPALISAETFIYDLEVAEGRRGEGLGRALLEAAEAWCADHSVGTLKLHVFGSNETAISLYESSGFEVTNLDMAKQIR